MMGPIIRCYRDAMGSYNSKKFDFVLLHDLLRREELQSEEHGSFLEAGGESLAQMVENFVVNLLFTVKGLNSV